MKRVFLRPVQLQGANGFPISLYRPAMVRIREKVLQQLEHQGYQLHNVDNFSVEGVDIFQYAREGEDWLPMVRYLESRVEERAAGGEVICIGHSFGGGIVTALAARRPELVQSVILIEPPLFNFTKRIVWAVCHKIVPISMAQKFHPAISGALKKREEFDSKEDAREYFSQRRVFSTMEPEVFEIFMNECLVPYDYDTDQQRTGQSKVKLLFSIENEVGIYHRVPYDIPVLCKNILNQYGLKRPGKYYYTKHKSSILQASDYKWVFSNYKNLTCTEFYQSHFWPLEDTEGFSDAMAQDVIDIILAEQNNS